jgi:FtsH-binding integral membrane protein
MNLNVFTQQDATRIAEAVKATDKTAEQVAEQGKDPEGKAPQVTEDSLYARVLKYIPAPLIGLYLLAVNTFLSVFKTEETARKVSTWITFVVAAILIAVYLKQRGVKRVTQIGISLLAFVAWAVASPGPFQQIHKYEPWWGTVALILVSAVFLSVKIEPLPESVINETKP